MYWWLNGHSQLPLTPSPVVTISLVLSQSYGIFGLCLFPLLIATLSLFSFWVVVCFWGVFFCFLPIPHLPPPEGSLLLTADVHWYPIGLGLLWLVAELSAVREETFGSMSSSQSWQPMIRRAVTEAKCTEATMGAGKEVAFKKLPSFWISQMPGQLYSWG